MLLFNGYDLEHYLIHEDIDIQELPDRDNHYISIPSFNGDIYTGYRYGQKKITIPFKINAKTTENYINTVRIIKRILNSDIPRELILPDESNKYYYAVIEEFDCEEVFVGVGSGSMTFVCHDPYAYSRDYKMFECDDRKITTVVNNGTANCSPIINVSFTKDAHFLQCTNWDNRAILVGSRPSVDNENNVKNEVILHDPCETTGNWLPAGNVVDSDTDRVVEGNVRVSDDGSHITAGSYGTTVDRKWHGAAVRRNIGADISDFELVAKLKHNSKSESSSSGGTTTSGNYKVSATSVNVRSGRGTKYTRLGSVKKNDVLSITDISAGWGKITYNKKTAYISMDYVTKITTKTSTMATSTLSDSKIYTENKMGRIELYGFDKNGQKLFKFVLRDSQEYYEYTEPELFIGNTLVLSDEISCPTPNKKTVKDENDKNKTVSTESGRFGDWNEYYGEFRIGRTTTNGSQYWYCEVNKFKDGKALSSPKLVKSNLNSSKYPKGDLNHVVLWFGQYKDKPPVDEIGLTDLVVTRLNEVKKEDNFAIFQNGDELEVDCVEGVARLNGVDYTQYIDIGSEFFTCDNGTSQFICQSDDTDIGVATVIQEKWI